METTIAQNKEVKSRGKIQLGGQSPTTPVEILAGFAGACGLNVQSIQCEACIRFGTVAYK